MSPLGLACRKRDTYPETSNPRTLLEQHKGAVFQRHQADCLDKLVRQVHNGRSPFAPKDSPLGLAAVVWAQNINGAHRVAKRLDAGTVWINMYRALHFATPFGGSKLSGYGRENGMDGFAEVTKPKAIWIESSDEAVGDPFVLR